MTRNHSNLPLAVWRQVLLKAKLPHRNKFVVIDNGKNRQLLNYTFLESSMRHTQEMYGGALDGRLGQGVGKQLQGYVDQLRQHGKYYQDLAAREIGPQDLNSEVITQTSSQFQALQQSIIALLQSASVDQQSSANIAQLAKIIALCNILHPRIWHLALHLLNTRSHPPHDHTLALLLTHYSLLQRYRFHPHIKKPSYKFMLHATHLGDVYDFDYFARRALTQGALGGPKGESVMVRLECMEQLVYCKGVRLDSRLVEYCTEAIKSIVCQEDIIKMEDLFKVYHFCSAILKKSQLSHIVQNMIFKKLQSLQISESPEKLCEIIKIKFILQFLRNSVASEGYKKQMLTEFIIPALLKYLRSKQPEERYDPSGYRQKLVQIGHLLLAFGHEYSTYAFKIVEMINKNEDKLRQAEVLTAKCNLIKSKQVQSVEAIRERFYDSENILSEAYLDKKGKATPSNKFWAAVLQQIVKKQNIIASFKGQNYSKFLIKRNTNVYQVILDSNFVARSLEGITLKFQAPFLRKCGVAEITVPLTELEFKLIYGFQDRAEGKRYLGQYIDAQITAIGSRIK